MRLQLKFYNLYGRWRAFELDSIPASNLSALEMWDVLESDQSGDKFNALVVASKQLEILRIPTGMVFSTFYGKLPRSRN